MTKFEKRMLIGLAFLVILLSVLEAMVPEPTDWSPSFSQYHRKPYGAKHLHDRLTDLFPEVRTITDPPYTIGYDRNELQGDPGPVNHIYITSNFELDRINTDQLLAMVEKGDHLFVAAESFHGVFADTLMINTDLSLLEAVDDTSDIRFVGAQRIAPGVFRYSRGFPDAFFDRYDTSGTHILAVNGSSHPVLLQMAWGEGKILLCSAPLAFTNYNLLKGDNAAFIAGAFSALPYRPVFWDEFLKLGRQGSSTPLRYILSQPPLRWAWYFALALIILYILTRARREQRAIPIVRPLRNTTRELTDTIGRMYWQKGDHAGIARRMIAHFKEEIRLRTYLASFAYDRHTIGHLAVKTGLSEQETERRLRAIEQREKAGVLTENELLKLSRELHEFRQLI